LYCQPNGGFNKIIPNTRINSFPNKKKINGHEYISDKTKRGDPNKGNWSNGRLVKSYIKQLRNKIVNASQTYGGSEPTGRTKGDSHKPTHIVAINKTAKRESSEAD
jgi:hypothetical protein